ncbi:MAG: YggS family pyridoxal phosphate-dependent enzyme [Halobacteriovoraceae bacterium]|nr:YggS family pyridoxal phosphate-dependent enzyme [Halobacteriovoraceae bacterium]|tara:strand:+ start:5228 stop:5890 length:663 start_codon:yes stop_codon:yes gene_type:complete
MSVQENLSQINNQLQGRTKLLAVSKTKPVELIKEAYELGQMDFGENKVQDLYEKAQDLESLAGLRWHFIGTLQSNKINKLLSVPGLYAIHSIDSLKLLKKLLKREISSEVRIYLQVNTSGENEKSGFENFEDLEHAVRILKEQEVWKLTGLMTIGSIRAQDFEKAAQASFGLLRDYKQKLDQKYDLDLELSMGMSQDFKIAMEYGSDWVRIGTQIFGSRE